MIGRSQLIYKYDPQNDILDVFTDKVRPVFADEIYYGIYEYVDQTTEEFAGVSIVNYTSWDKDELNNFLYNKRIPIEVNYNYI